MSCGMACWRAQVRSAHGRDVSPKICWMDGCDCCACRCTSRVVSWGHAGCPPGWMRMVCAGVPGHEVRGAVGGQDHDVRRSRPAGAASFARRLRDVPCCRVVSGRSRWGVCPYRHGRGSENAWHAGWLECLFPEEAHFCCCGVALGSRVVRCGPVSVCASLGMRLTDGVVMGRSRCSAASALALRANGLGLAWATRRPAAA